MRFRPVALSTLAILLALAGSGGAQQTATPPTQAAARVWRLAEVQVNPEKKPLDTPAVGLTGTASESTLTWRKRAEDRGRVVQDFTATFTIEKPPAELHADQPVTVRLSGRLAGTWTGYAPGHPGQWLRFAASNGLRLRPIDGIAVSSAQTSAAVDLVIEALARAPDTLTFDAFIVNYCSGCRIRWIYRAEPALLVKKADDPKKTPPNGGGAATVGAIDVFDGNPGLLKTGRPLDDLTVPELAAGALESRDGAVADGLSQLILRAEVGGPGTVSCVVARPEDGTCRPLRAGAVRGKHYAFAAYTPPDGFGPGTARERPVPVRLELTPASGKAGSRERALRLARPPVVLVHGTFSDIRAWSTLTPRLAQAGFRPFLVDFSRSNGQWTQGPSTFQDNRGVVWERGHHGIEHALDVFRRQHRLAATQADVVGHSMGGLLARVWASDAFTGDHPAGGYRRPGNFRRGDIHRLITLCTPHYGSDVARAAFALKDVSVDQLSAGEWASKNALLFLADWIMGLKKGAVTDQIPESEALRRIGATRVPAHAIACVALPPDIRSDWGYTKLYRSLAAAFFQAEGAMLQQVLAGGAEGEASHRHLWQLMEAVDWRDRSWMYARTSISDEDLLVTALRAALFGNTASDAVVRLESQWGGLAPQHRTTMRGVLHSPAPDVAAVQDRILDLLREGPPGPGGGSSFAPGGFPTAGRGPIDQPPGIKAQSFEDRLEAIRRSNIVPRHAQVISEVARARDELILFRPVNAASTILIAQDDATKNMHVKGKSADWGPHEGYIAADQALSKLAARGDPQEVGAYNCEVKTSVEHRIVALEALVVERGGRRFEVHRLVAQRSGQVASTALDPLPDYACEPPVPEQLRQPRPAFVEHLRRVLPPRGQRPQLVLVEPGTGRQLDPEDPGVPARAPGPTEVLHVLADPNTRRYLTADYDLLAVGTKRAPLPLPVVPDTEMGYVSQEQKDLIHRINVEVGKAGYNGGDVVHHGPENQFARSPGVDYPVTAFEPDGSIVSIPEGPPGRTAQHLKRYFLRRINEGWHMWPNPRWNWDARGTPRERQFNSVQGWPDEDAPILPAVILSDDNDGPDGP